MQLFDRAGFENGEWAGRLASLLRTRRLIVGRHPRARLYRHTWTNWIQIEPAGFSGPAHWLGKPAVVAQDSGLFAGYYIERGLDQHQQPEYVIAPEWHWHAFRWCLRNPNRRKEIDAITKEVNAEGRQASAFCGNRRFEPPYGGETTLIELEQFAGMCPANEWINVYLGARFDIEQCLDLQQQIVEKLVGPLLRGREIEAIVLEAREKLLST